MEIENQLVIERDDNGDLRITLWRVDHVNNTQSGPLVIINADVVCNKIDGDSIITI